MLHLSASSVWRPIAKRPRSARKAPWIEIEGAPMSLAEAQRLREAGAVVTTLRYYADTVEVLVAAVPPISS